MRFDAKVVQRRSAYRELAGEKCIDRSRGAALAVACLAALALALVARAPEAHGESPTRQAYVTTLERICKPRVQATERAMKGVRKDLRAERTKVGAAKFRRGAHIFAGTISRIEAVPEPPADVHRLKKWFGYLREQERYLQAITHQLAAGQGIKAQRSTARFIHNGNLANNVVLAFGFNYCSFKFSRFG
jgi:hypothetical protein